MSVSKPNSGPTNPSNSLSVCCGSSDLSLWMEVCSPAMGPERILPSSEDELGEDERPVDGAVLQGGAVWVGGEEGGETELDGEEEEEEVNSGGYYYQPLNQDPEGPNSSQQEEDEDVGEASQSEQLQHRIQVSSAAAFCLKRRQCLTCVFLQVMGLHLPEAPPADSDEEEDPEGAAAQRSRASIPMDAGETSPDSTCLQSRVSKSFTSSLSLIVFVESVDIGIFEKPPKS